MSTAPSTAPSAGHDPADPFHSTACCAHCRTERADGLSAYRAWRDRHHFPADVDAPVRLPAEPKAVVRRARVELVDRPGGPVLSTTMLDGWDWRVLDEDGHSVTGGWAPTWPAALAQADAAVSVERMGIRGLVRGLVAA